jgi:hypothetical protein
MDNWAIGVAQVVVCLLGKREILNSNPSSTTKKKERKKYGQCPHGSSMPSLKTHVHTTHTIITTKIVNQDRRHSQDFRLLPWAPCQTALAPKIPLVLSP